VSERPGGPAEQVPGYRLGRRIGRGGFAVVHEAEQLSLGRAVAVKMLSPERADERELRRFDRERVLLSELSRHRHVVDVIDAGTASDGRPFIVMRLYRRGSLAQALADGGPMPPRLVVDTVAKLAGALQAAHGLGVIHRDVKPENVLIADDGEPALADFGISALSGPDRTTGNVFTMAHAAPEVLDRGDYGVASDVYALASTAYTLLTGHPPFVEGNQYAQMRAIVESPVPPMGVPGVPPALEAAVVRGMAKRPQDRYPNAVALADALRYALDVQGWQVDRSSGGVPPGQGVPFAQGTPANHGAPPAPPVLPGPPGQAGAPSDVTVLLAPTPPARPRRRAAGWLSAAAVLVLVGGVLGATYAFDVPPGSLLAHRTATTQGPAAVTVAVDFSEQDIPAPGNPTNLAVELYLKRLGNTVGGRPVTVRRYDVASPAHKKWDSEACRSAARRHLAALDEVAVVGPYNSGCAKILVPIVGKDPARALAVVSNGSTDPGLTKAWEAGEPDVYYPGGVRTFARVVTTDDIQGKAAAAFAAGDLGVKSVLVLDDGGTYGKHVAATFASAAQAAGIRVVGQAQWKSSGSHQDLFTAAAKAVDGGPPDAVFLGGAVAHDGPAVVRDKVAVLGDNQRVRLIAPDGFAGEPQLAKLAEAQGMYITFPGLSPANIRLRGGAGSDFLNAYQAAYGADPPDPYALYGVAALQVVLAAIRQSDGTRKGVREALFSGAGVTVPRAESVLGADLRIDPATGDVTLKDLTIEVIKRNEETFEKVQTVP